MEFISVFNAFDEKRKMEIFCLTNNIEFMVLDIPEDNNYNNNIKYFSTTFPLKDKLIKEFIDYDIIHNINSPFIYYKKCIDENGIKSDPTIIYHYPRDRMILQKNKYIE